MLIAFSEKKLKSIRLNIFCWLYVKLIILVEMNMLNIPQDLGQESTLRCQDWKGYLNSTSRLLSKRKTR
jgi:hypothetical protein